MPKKRRTKTVQSSKASAPSGGNESSNSSNEDKREKLELYLKDFDMRVANCLLQADNECKAICAAINHACMMELFKLPKNIREMTRAEFMAKGGSVNNNMLHQVTEVVDSITSSILPPTSAEHKTVSSSQGESSATESTQGAEGTTATKKKASAKGRKRTTTATKRKTQKKSVLGTNQNVNTEGSAGPPQTLRRSTRKASARNTFVTPAARTGKAGKALGSGWDTPAITPKFDPRLPVTPATCAMREARRGETMMSLSGSPLSLPSAKPDGNIIKFGDGTALEIVGSSPKVDMSINETTRQNILLLQNKLAKILKTCSTGQEDSVIVSP
ncbi:borealin-like [Asterias amurensis]|uniref:borealin-like n=1 Tax=Asterias amurensis TaxID=7602 RepID=UPI003AB636E3